MAQEQSYSILPTVLGKKKSSCLNPYFSFFPLPNCFPLLLSLLLLPSALFLPHWSAAEPHCACAIHPPSLILSGVITKLAAGWLLTQTQMFPQWNTWEKSQRWGSCNAVIKHRAFIFFNRLALNVKIALIYRQEKNIGYRTINICLKKTKN